MFGGIPVKKRRQEEPRETASITTSGPEINKRVYTAIPTWRAAFWKHGAMCFHLLLNREAAENSSYRGPCWCSGHRHVKRRYSGPWANSISRYLFVSCSVIWIHTNECLHTFGLKLDHDALVRVKSELLNIRGLSVAPSRGCLGLNNMSGVKYRIIFLIF